jgi:GNAT superfamily N-acetyltransferase
VPPGIAADNGVGLHFVDGALHRVVSSRPDARAYRVERAPNGVARETEIVPQYIARGPALRRASVVDIDGILTAHAASVTGIAARDYAPDQIAAWTRRIGDPKTKDALRAQILGERVWVLEIDGRIEGYAHMRMPHELAPAAYLHALYITPAGAAQGYGKRLMGLVELAARQERYARLLLHSSKTAVGFYERLGFTRAGPPLLHDVQGVGLECLPMGKELPPL